MKTVILSLLVLGVASLHSAYSQEIPEDAENMGHVNMVPNEDGEVEFEEKFDPAKLTKADLEKHCSKLAKDWKCEEEETRKICPEICAIWDEQQKMAPRTIWVDIDRDDFSFFDLSAKKFHDGEWLNFERFEGYLTVVANVGKLCDTNADIENVIIAMNSLFKVMPYSLNIMLFPFKPSQVGYEGKDCSAFEEYVKKASLDPKLKKKLFIMEEAELNGPDTHSVYEYLKSKSDLEPMADTHSTFFFVSGEGNRIDLFQAASFSQLRGHIVRLSTTDYGASTKTEL